ncbi:hypothetical protein [Actinomadura flavalba]|uniref:hypothetical protein n=1 Tax=Actinomadura flavalba TaxID=1120938 RepID=UPI001F0ADF64|nr:hypothetical protein [Actinomadura flavalba]
MSVALAFGSWVVSKGAEDQARADRWGIFVGEWAPTFFALGTALRLEERWDDRKADRRAQKAKEKAREAMPV